jgi:micrococcal nuclease
MTRIQGRCLVLLMLSVGVAWAPTTLFAERGQTTPAVEAAFIARVEHVVDGDTIDVRHRDGSLTRIRVHGIDCPERGKPFSNVARNFTRSMVFGKDVRIVVKDIDRYGRRVGQVRIGDQDLAESLVDAGLAWQFHRYSDDPRLEFLERAARESRRGLWKFGGDPRGPRDIAPQP